MMCESFLICTGGHFLGAAGIFSENSQWAVIVTQLRNKTDLLAFSKGRIGRCGGIDNVSKEGLLTTASEKRKRGCCCTSFLFPVSGHNTNSEFFQKFHSGI